MSKRSVSFLLHKFEARANSKRWSAGGGQNTSDSLPHEKQIYYKRAGSRRFIFFPTSFPFLKPKAVVVTGEHSV